MQAVGATSSSPHQQVPQSTWPALARAFQMFFLATSLPPLQQPPADAAASIAIAAAAAAAANMGRGGSAASSITSDTGGSLVALAAPSAEQVAADATITAAVLDCLSDTVLSSCQHAPVEVRWIVCMSALPPRRSPGPVHWCVSAARLCKTYGMRI